MKKLILIRGVSGAGKSTMAAMLGQRENTHTIAAESPKYWKLWKYTTPVMLVGVVAVVVGCVLAINGWNY